MSGLFIGILNMSLSASCVALIVMLIRLALKKAPKIYSYALWAVVFVRLICPFTIQMPVSAVPVQPQTIPSDIVYSQSPSIKSGVPAVDHAVNHAIDSSLPAAVPTNSVNPVQAALTLGSYIWLAGVLVLLLYGLFSYIRLQRKVQTAIRVYDNIYETDLIETPFVLGVIHPRIYIPTGLNVKEREYVEAHERTHIKRLDHLIKPLAFLISCAYWFNPIVWISYVLMAKDIELSADESVMKRYDFDIRGDYAGSLLALSVKKSSFPSPLAFGETGVKVRVKNVLNYKKPAFWVSIVAIVIVAAVSFSLIVSRKSEAASGHSSNQGIGQTVLSEGPSDIKAAYQTNYKTVNIDFNSSMMGFKNTNTFETSDPATVAYIDSTIKSSTTAAQADNLKNNYTNQYTVKLSNEAGEYGCVLYYDTLYDKAYLEKDGGLFETGTDFARYIDSFLENRNITFNMDENDVALFKKYGWTLDYQINSVETKLGDIGALSSFNPNVYYFAYNNELSKNIGLDMSPYVNGDIDVKIYRIRESMPQEFHPAKDCRGIVVKSGGKTVGAYISAGRHSAFNACSLKGGSFQQVTGQTLEKWLADRIKADDAEKKLSNMEPEKVIGEYFTALANKDAGNAECCLAKKMMLGDLTSNMLNEQLYNGTVALPLTNTEIEANSNFENLKNVKLVDVKLIEKTDDHTRIYRVQMDLQYNKDISIESGEQSWDCYMEYESPQTGWKIDGFGQG